MRQTVDARARPMGWLEIDTGASAAGDGLSWGWFCAMRDRSEE